MYLPISSKQPAPLPPPLSILNSPTVILSITTFQTLNFTDFSKLKNILLGLLLKLLNLHISLSFFKSLLVLRSTNALNINSFSYLQSSYNQSHGYLHNLISLQPSRSNRSTSVVVFSRPATISSLKITDSSFRPVAFTCRARPSLRQCGLSYGQLRQLLKTFLFGQ